MDISGKNVVITGGSSGIGAAFALSVADAGGNAWVVDLQAPSEDSSSSEQKQDSRIQYLLGDVREEASVEEVVQRIDEAAGGIDVLINNAAILRDQTLVAKLGKVLKKHSSEDWRDTIATNLTGVFLMGRAVAAAMIRRKHPGLIVNITSISRKGNAGQSAYAASKAGVEALTVTWSQELAPYRIRVVGIAPGFVETNMTRNIPPLFLSRLRGLSSQKRFGALEEFGHALRFVVANDYFDGKILELDGGIRF